MRGDPPSLGETVAGILGTFTLDDGLSLTCYACTPPREVASPAQGDGLDAVVLTALDHARTAHPIRRRT